VSDIHVRHFPVVSFAYQHILANLYDCITKFFISIRCVLIAFVIFHLLTASIAVNHPVSDVLTKIEISSTVYTYFFFCEFSCLKI